MLPISVPPAVVLLGPFYAIIAPIVAAYLLTILIWCFLTFDQLVRLEYSDYRPLWDKDGQPHGIFWFAPEQRKVFGISLRNQWAFSRVNLVWLSSTPTWMKENTQAVRLVHRLRILALLWNGSLLLFIIMIVVLGSR